MYKKLIYHRSGIITLYDRHSDQSISGSLILNKRQKQPNLEPMNIESDVGTIKETNNEFKKVFIDHYLKIQNKFNLFIKNAKKTSLPKLTGHGINVRPVNTKNLNYNLLSKITFSVSLISFLFLVVYFLSSQLSLFSNPKLIPATAAEIKPQIGFEQPIRQFEPAPDPTPASREFQINIEKIGLFSDITTNVDLADEAVYKQKLNEDGVAHALGSYFPGQNGPVYLFAHSTDTLANIPLFNAKFFALKNLEVGDEMKISYQGKQYTYLIRDKQIIQPDQISSIQNTTSKLVLQTCWPPGTDWQRLIIFANPI